jgi:2-haloacid dehalogenase
VSDVACDAVVFDALGTLFQLRPLEERLEELGAPEGALDAWFERLLHSAATVTLAGDFVPFAELARTALATASARLGIELEPDDVLPLLERLPPYPDARPAVERLREEGAAWAVLTNGGLEQTRGLLEAAGLADRVWHVASVEEVRAYKPHPAPYRRVVELLELPPERVALVSAHGWDVVGARAAGLRAVWVDRVEHRWPFPSPEPPRAPDLERAVALATGTAEGAA